MAWLDKEVQARERDRYYLFAGMGGRRARQQRRRVLIGALLAAVSVALGLCALFYLINKPL
jgi:hypothetical protein